MCAGAFALRYVIGAAANRKTRGGGARGARGGGAAGGSDGPGQS